MGNVMEKKRRNRRGRDKEKAGTAKTTTTEKAVVS